MNVGLKQYIDTRIAVSLFNTLPPLKKETIGVKLLTQATTVNPYNPAPWYLLAAQTTSATQGVALARTANEHVPDDKEKHEPPPVQYWRTLTQFVAEQAVLRHPVPKDDAAARRVYEFLKSGVHGISAEELAPYAQRFEAKAAKG
jgi:hypothetical protein